MESSRICKFCKKKSVIRDDESGTLVCSSCGRFSPGDFDNFQHHTYGVNDSQGTYIRIGSSSNPADFDYKAHKLYIANKKIEEITSILGFSTSTTNKVKQMMEQITEGELGAGNWFSIFTGACCYVVRRKDRFPLPMAEVAAGIGCDVYELGKMVSRVVSFLGLNLCEFNLNSLLEKTITNFHKFSQLSKEVLTTMIKQGILLMNCSVKWFLTTGRQPGPVVVGVMVFVAELNGVEVGLEEVAGEVHAAVSTCRTRYKELKETLVKVAQALPWGKNVTFKNIVMNAPLVIRYIEMNARLEPGKEGAVSVGSGGFDIDEMVKECLQKAVASDTEDYYCVENDSQYPDPESEIKKADSEDFVDLENVKLSQERLSSIYTQFSSNRELASLKDLEGENHRHKRKKDFSLKVSKKWWTGDSDMSKKLYLEELLKKNVGYDGLPPSFVAGESAVKRRREKICVAKQRISEIMQPSSSAPAGKKDTPLLKCVQDRRKGKRKTSIADTDWEDYIIETLLLHQVKEEEIEQGYYKRMIDLYVFDSEGTCKILGSTMKSKTQTKFKSKP